MPDLIKSRDISNQILTIAWSGYLETILNNLPFKAEQPCMDQGGVWETNPASNPSKDYSCITNESLLKASSAEVRFFHCIRQSLSEG